MLPLSAQATPISFQFAYLDGASEGFLDTTYGAQRQAALQYAGNSWGSLLSASYVGETIRVSVTMDPLGTTGTYLATSSALNTYWDNSKYPDQNTIYSSAQANHFRGYDLNTASNEIKITFNGDYNYYLGTDGKTTKGSYDFVSLAMHEIVHGLGFFSRIDKDNSDGVIGGMMSTTSSSGSIYNYASSYDRFLIDATGASLLSMTDTERAAAITGGALYWGGAKGAAGNNGVQPELYAPVTPVAGSSITHLDKDSTRDLLMEPNMPTGRPVAADTVTLGMLADIGWTITAVPEPSSWLLMLSGLLCLAALKRRH